MFELQLPVQLILNSQLSQLSIVQVYSTVRRRCYTLSEGFSNESVWLGPSPDMARERFCATPCTIYTSRTSSTGRCHRATFLRCSAWLRLRRSSKSPHSIRQCSAATGQSRICRSSRRCGPERAVNERMSQHLQSNGLLPENQSAYTEAAPRRKPLF